MREVGRVWLYAVWYADTTIAPRYSKRYSPLAALSASCNGSNVTVLLSIRTTAGTSHCCGSWVVGAHKALRAVRPPIVGFASSLHRDSSRLVDARQTRRVVRIIQ